MTRIMRHYRSIAALALVLALTGCAKAPPSLSPTGKAAFQAIQVVHALDVLRDVAIDAEAQKPKLLSTENTRRVLVYQKQVVQTIRAVPEGWKGVAVAGLDQLEHDIPADQWARLKPFVVLLRTLFQGGL